MGGLGAIDYAARRPHAFRAAASFSGVLHPLGSPDVWLGLFSSYTDDADARLLQLTGMTLEGLEQEWAAWAVATYG